MPDRLTRDEYKIHAAMNCLKTVLPLIEQERSQIKLSDRMIRLRLAEMHAWVGNELLNTGEASQRGLHLRKSLSVQLWQPETLKSCTGLAARRCAASRSGGWSGRSKVKLGLRKDEAHRDRQGSLNLSIIGGG